METRFYQSPLIENLNRTQDSALRLAELAEVDASEYPSVGDPDFVRRVQNRLAADFSVIVVGEVSSGKSSLINSLLGRRLFVPADRATDGVISVVLPADDADQEGAEKILKDGTSQPFDSVAEGLEFIRQGGDSFKHHEECEEVRLRIAHPLLSKVRFVNTPGLGDRLNRYEATTRRYLRAKENDLIIWTFEKGTPVTRAEVEFFSEELRQRKGNIIGVMTHCLEGREGDHDYHPENDPEVIDALEYIWNIVGDEFLANLIPYDSHVARNAVSRLSENGSGGISKDVQLDLERSGYLNLQEFLDSYLGGDEGEVRSRRIAMMRQDLASQAVDLSHAMGKAAELFGRAANETQGEADAWKSVEERVVGPVRRELRTDLRTIASRRADELVALMSSAAEQAVDDNFNLLGTLFRTLGSKIRVCDPTAIELRREIDAEISRALKRADYYERLSEAADRAIRDQLQQLQQSLEHGAGETRPDVEFTPGSSAPTGAADDVIGRAVAASLKGAVSGLLKKLAGQLEAAAAKKAGEQAAKGATKTTLGAGAAKAAGVVTLILVPFDIHKLVKEFGSGKERLKQTIRKRYAANANIYALRISDAIIPRGDAVIDALLADARSGAKDASAATAEARRRIAEAEALERELRRVAEELSNE